MFRAAFFARPPQFPGDGPAGGVGLQSKPEPGSFSLSSGRGYVLHRHRDGVVNDAEKKPQIVVSPFVLLYRSAEAVNHPGTQSPCGPW